MSHSAFHKRTATTTPQERIITPSPNQDNEEEQQTPHNHKASISPLQDSKQKEDKPYIQDKEYIHTHKDAYKPEALLDNAFLMDSLNGVSMSKPEEQKSKDVLMGLLKDSIAYFEHNSIAVKKQNENISNQTTTANSLNRSVEFPHGFHKLSDNSVGSINDIRYLKNENLTLQLKYNELKLANKKLLAEYNKLRTQIEDTKQIKLMYEGEVQLLTQRLKDTELRLEHMTDLYTREKIEKENNSLAFKSIIEQMANKGRPTFDRQTYENTSFTPANDAYPIYTNDIQNEEQIMQKIRRIETGLADKDKELKSLKAALRRDRMSPPLCSSSNVSPMQSTSKISFNEKGYFLSPPCSVHNACKGLIREPQPPSEAQNHRISTIAHKPKYSDLKYIPAMKKDESLHKPSPKASPGYDKQTAPKGIIKKTKNTGQILPKH